MHAYLTSRTPELIKQELVASGVRVSQNSDVLFLRYSELSVDDARTISSFAFLKAVSDAKYFVIAFDRAGHEAQNALLKVVEEAPGNSHFYFSTPNPGSILPTLRSRCVVERSEHVAHDRDDVSEFLRAGYAERLLQVERMVAQAQRAQDRTPLREFARALVRARPCQATLDAARYLEQNGASPKLVLSHLAVAL